MAAALLACVAALVATPLVSLAAIGLHGDVALWPHLAAYVLPVATLNTALLLAGVAFVAALAGVGPAWAVTAYEFPGRGVLLWLLPLPLAFPTYIVAYVYADLLDGLGPVQSMLRAAFGWRTAAEYWFPSVRSLGGAVFVMGFVLYPYVFLAARAMFQTQNAGLIDMAHVMGAGQWRRARDITLPLARPAIVAGLALAMLEALNDIGAAEYLGVQTLTLSVFNTWLNRSSLGGAAQIACAMLVAVAGLIALERAGRRGRRFTGLDGRSSSARRIALSGSRSALAFAACALPPGLGFVAPLAFLVHQTITHGLLVGFDPALVRHASQTVLLAGVATAVTVALGFGAAFGVRLLRTPFAHACFFIAGLGYAVPGTVLALALLSPLIAVDEAINRLTRAVAGADVGLLIAGSGGAIVCAYAVRFLAIATGFAQAGLGRISHELDDAARSMGTTPGGVIRAIHLPLLKPALFGAALLVFVDCLKELPATLLLRPLGVETLATYIYQFATRGSFEEGSLAGLLIVLVGILPVIYLVRHADDATRAAASRGIRAPD